MQHLCVPERGFPFPVMLVHKDRTILAVNKTGETEGYPTGIRCVDLEQKEHHMGCLANQALAEQTAMRVVAYSDFPEAVLDSYWILLMPVKIGFRLTIERSYKLLNVPLVVHLLQADFSPSPFNNGVFNKF